ncbi:MAG: hypothetical protein JXP34_10770 [Planctomycetes bacterium]|nr:hypothetical protein [Planctomycetota bacterium]
MKEEITKRPRVLRGLGWLAAAFAAGCAAPPRGGLPNGVAIVPIRLEVSILSPEPGPADRARIARELGDALRASLETLSRLPCRVGEPGPGEASLRLAVSRIERIDGDPVLYSAWELRDPSGALLDAYSGRFDTAKPPTTGPGVSRTGEGEGVDRLVRDLRLYALAIADRVAGRLRRGSSAEGEGRP